MVKDYKNLNIRESKLSKLIRFFNLLYTILAFIGVGMVIGYSWAYYHFVILKEVIMK